MEELVLIKLGGSLITDKTKPYTARLDVIKRLSEEIHQARLNQKINLVVGHGGGSFPHTSAHKYQTHKGITSSESYKGISAVQNDAAKLNRIVVDGLINSGENAISIQLSSVCLARNGKITEFFSEPLKKMLEYNMIPVPYGDVGIDLETGCSIISTEEILSFLTKNLNVKKIIMCGIVDGVYDGNPNDLNSKIIPEINIKNFSEIEKCLGGSAGTDVTGGMLLKVKKGLEMAKLGCEVYIINGNVPDNLLKCLNGEKIGTIIRE